jgi:hypothetical protein
MAAGVPHPTYRAGIDAMVSAPAGRERRLV